MKLSIVIAGNMKQYEYFLRKYGLNKNEYRYVYEPHHLYAFKIKQVIFTGRYQDNKLWSDERYFNELKVIAGRYNAKIIWDRDR